MLCTYSNTCLYAQPNIELIPFSSAYSSPVAIENCGDNRLFIVQQRGAIIISDSLGNKLATPFINLSDVVSQTGNERGLLGLAFDPDYANNGYFYVNYTGINDGHTRIARYSRSTSNANLADPASGVVLLTINQPYSNHNGGNIEFGPDGYLYIGMGDGGSGGDPQGYAQNTQSLLGKILRIDVHSGNPYSIPATNPFVGSTTVLPEIWAIGVRNPWRFSFDRFTGDLWIGDVGQNAWEEIDFQAANSAGGQNYGWNCYEGNSVYNINNCIVGTHAAPIYVYDNDLEGCSVTGGVVYRGAQYGNMHGYYLFADFCSGKFWATMRNQALGTFNTTEIKDTSEYQYVAFGEDNYGEMYVGALSSGLIFKVRSTQCAPAAIITNSQATTICEGSSHQLQALWGKGLSYQWLKDGVAIPNATANLYNATNTGNYSVEVRKSATCMAVSSAVNVTVKANPTPIIQGNDNICEDSSLQHTYSVPLVNGHSYVWSITTGNGVIVSGQGSNQITVQWNSGSTGTVEVVETNP